MFSLFSKKKAPLALPKPDFNRAADPMRKNFATARFGNTFRTLSVSFTHSGGPQTPVYRQATWMGGVAGWRVFEVAAQMPESGLPPHFKIKADNLDFISAVEHLAEWQIAQIKEGLSCDRAEIEKLGTSYFVAFGERENLVFDAFEQPHTTFKGEVTGEGYFSDEARERAKATLGQLPVPTVPLKTIDPFAETLANVVPPPDSLNALFEKIHQYARQKDLLKKYQDINKSLTENDFSSPRTFNRQIDVCKALIEKINLTKEETAFFRNINILYRIAYNVMSAKFHMKEFEKRGGGESYVSMAKECMQQAETLYSTAGAPANALWKIKAFVLEETDLKLPQTFSDFAECFEKALAERDAQIQLEKRAALSVQPLPSLPGPK